MEQIEEDNTQINLLYEEEPEIRVRIKRPTLLGINITYFLTLFYLISIVLTLFNIILVIYTSAGLKAGYVITILFGILGPISIVYWSVALWFIITGARCLFGKSENYLSAATDFRKWYHATLFMLVAWMITSLQFLFGCYMFVTLTSLENSVKIQMDLNGADAKTKKRGVKAARVYDWFIKYDPSTDYTFPLNFIVDCGRQHGLWIPLIGVIPSLLIYAGSYSQRLYYRWRFESAIVKID